MKKTIVTATVLSLLMFGCSEPNKKEQEIDIKSAEKTNDKPKGKQTPPVELGTLDGAEATAFYAGVNAMTAYYPIAFYEDLMRGRITKDAEEKTGNPRSLINQFGLVRNLRGPEFKQIATPNNDTYYAQAYCELSIDALVFHIPPMEENRYFVFQLWDPYGDTFDYLGSRLIGNKGGDYLFTGPDFKGKVPKGLTEVKVAYNNFVVWGRIGVLPGENDDEKIHAIQDALKLTFLSDFQAGNANVKPYDEEASKTRLALTIPPDLPEGLEWLFKISEALKHTPAKGNDASILSAMEYIGFTDKGTNFNYKTLSEPQIRGLKKAIQYSLHLMDITAQSIGIEVNGWRWSPKSGILGDDYLFRAAWAKWYTGGNSAEEAIYMDGRKDDKGEPFNPIKKYVIHFEKNQLPRVKAFWSISMYHISDGSFVANEINRYSIGSNTQSMKYNEDGSLDIYIQSTPPENGAKKENWLPSPKHEGFYLNFRLYNPDTSLQDGTWEPPFVKIVEN
jgi:hypothetical protein